LSWRRSHPGVKFFIYVADVTDDDGQPIVSFMQEDEIDDPKGREGNNS
jgi:hypothetical protein